MILVTGGDGCVGSNLAVSLALASRSGGSRPSTASTGKGRELNLPRLEGGVRFDGQIKLDVKPGKYKPVRRESRTLGAQPAPEEHRENAKPIERGEFLAFGSRTSPIVHRHLVDALSAQEQSRGDLRFDLKPPRA